MIPRRVLTVAWREFATTVFARAFIFGVLLMPLVIGSVLGIAPRLVRSPPASGSLGVIDRTGRVAPRLQERLKSDPELGSQVPGEGSPWSIHPEVLPSDASTPAETAHLLGTSSAPASRIALVVISEEALRGERPVELYSGPRFDVLLRRALTDRIADAVVDARLEASGYDAARVRELNRRPTVQIRTVTPTGVRDANELARVLVPFGFMMLLWAATFTAGQFLLTTLVEEKSMRVMEVLLSAVSSLELMVGKILGYAGVGAVVLAMYLGLGVFTLRAIGADHLWEGSIAPLLAAYFVIAFLLLASLMAAIGSVVDDVRSAQALLAPVLLLMAVPTVLWLPITRDPGSTFATVLTLLPPFSPFIAVLRLASPDPVPAWQLALSLGLGLLSVIASVWMAAKIFRVGVLMYGKPPTFRTMLRWLRSS